MAEINTQFPLTADGSLDPALKQAQYIADDIVKLIVPKNVSIRIATAALEIAANWVQDLKVSFPFLPEESFPFAIYNEEESKRDAPKMQYHEHHSTTTP